MTPASLVLSTQRALTPEMLALCDEADGLIIVAGARAAGKSTLVGALIGHILQNRRDYVVTLENRIQAVHESRVSLVSQREVAPAQHAQGILAAVREGADVIVLDEIQTGAAAREVLEAARGHLVICALAAVDAASALDAYFDLLAAGERPAACETMSRVLRGVVAQRLARQNREGRFASRELLLNTPATSAMIAGGRFMHLSAELHA